MNAFLASQQPLLLALLSILAAYAVAFVRSHVKGVAAANALDALTVIAQGAAHAYLSAGNTQAGSAAALAAVVASVRRLAASEVTYLEGVHGTPKAAALIEGVAATALAAVSQ